MCTLVSLIGVLRLRLSCRRRLVALLLLHGHATCCLLAGAREDALRPCVLLPGADHPGRDLLAACRASLVDGDVIAVEEAVQSADASCPPLGNPAGTGTARPSLRRCSTRPC